MNVCLETEVFESPLGPVTLAFEQRVLVHVDFGVRPERMGRLVRKAFGDVSWRDTQTPGTARQAFEKYFEGDMDALAGLPTHARGTAFQQDVWQALREIPCGETRSYAEVARLIGKPAAIRAVANANAFNPLSIIVPCHRVIGTNGTLTGYAGGLAAKAWLLDHEKVRVAA